MDNYKILNKIDVGAHGSVFRAIDCRSNKSVALKRIGINIKQGIHINLVNEICALRVLKARNIVRLIEVTNLSNCVILVMEFLPCNLKNVIDDKKIKLSIARIKAYCIMILNGLSYIHGNNIMHRDIKPANLLISTHGTLKIGDFGLAIIFNKNANRNYSNPVATRWYRAPEILYGSTTYTPSIDMWSFGCIVAELINRSPLFRGDSDIQQLAIVLDSLGTPNNQNWPNVKELPDYHKIDFEPKPKRKWSEIIPTANLTTINFLSHILIYNSNKRFTAEQALHDQFFIEQPQPVELKYMPKPNEVNVKM